MPIALDATYSTGRDLSGVGVYSRQLLHALASEFPDTTFDWAYRPHRFLRSFGEPLPRNARRRLLTDLWPVRATVFHGLNQRLPKKVAGPAVTTFHDLFVMTAEYSTPEFRARFTEQARDAAARSDLIICVSNFTASQVESLLGVPAARLRVVHHGATPPIGRVETRRELVILSVGALQKRKNTRRLVQAFEQTPAGWRLVLAGARGYGAAAIHERIERSPRRADIELTGYVSQTELEKLYSRASIFAFPSLDEGFGLPVLDAMLRGLPVVASRSSALEEVAGKAALTVSDPTDTAEIAAALNRLIESERLRDVLADEGRRHAESFSWEKAARETWAVYKELGARGL